MLGVCLLFVGIVLINNGACTLLKASPRSAAVMNIFTGGLSLIIMNYMDAVSMDLERLQGCSMLCVTADGRTIPFCSYQLTDLDGKRLYPTWGIDDPSSLARIGR